MRRDRKNQPPDPAPGRSPYNGFWRRNGGGALRLSILFHTVALVIAALWGLQETRKVQPGGGFGFRGDGGGGDSGKRTKILQKKQSQVTISKNARRVFAEGATSDFKLPDMGNGFKALPTLASPGGGGMDGGWGGGMGGGIGGGFGRGRGSQTGAFAFGFTEPNPNALEGKFYDLKQTRDGVPTQITNSGVESAIVSFVSNGWKEESLRQYYQASKNLYQTRFLMPIMDANEAPRAFKCGPEVAPQRWIVVYRGVVTPPKSGRYRFVGAGDDVMVVRFNGRHVFDYGYCSGTTGMGISDNYWFFKGGTRNPKFKYHDNSRYPVPLPLTLHPYASTRIWNKDIGGIAAGAEFEAESGKPYPIEILISEIPGGLFCASLLIEEVGAAYQKTPEGRPILPLFRLDHSSPPQSTGDDNVPPFDPDGPVWKRLPGHGRLDI